MAIEVTQWVWNYSHSRLSDRLVLLAIADNANSRNGDGAWPSVSELMRKANLSERGVRGAIKNLQTLGELEVLYNAGPSGVNAYRVIMGDARPPDPGGPDTEGDDMRNLAPAKSAPAKFAPADRRQSLQGAKPAAQTAKPAAQTANFAENAASFAPVTVKEPSLNRPRTFTPPNGDDHGGDNALWTRLELPADDGKLNVGHVVAAYVEGARAADQPPPASTLKARVGRDARLLISRDHAPVRELINAAYDMGQAGWCDLALQLQRQAADQRKADEPAAAPAGRGAGGRRYGTLVGSKEEMEAAWSRR